MLADEPKIKLMLKKLCEQSEQGKLNDWVDTFIWDLDRKVSFGIPLTKTQIEKLEDIFDEC
jgi:hypothetical protein